MLPPPCCLQVGLRDSLASLSPPASPGSWVPYRSFCVVAAAIAGAVGNIIKQNRLYPVPKGGPDSPPDEKKQGGLPPRLLNAYAAVGQLVRRPAKSSPPWFGWLAAENWCMLSTCMAGCSLSLKPAPAHACTRLLPPLQAPRTSCAASSWPSWPPSAAASSSTRSPTRWRRSLAASCPSGSTRARWVAGAYRGAASAACAWLLLRGCLGVPTSACHGIALCL